MARLRFSMRSLLVATTFVAVLLGVLTWLGFPLQHPVVQSFLLAYAIFVGLWTILRGPSVVKDHYKLQERRGQLAKTRAALEREVAERRAAHRKTSTEDASCDSAGLSSE